MEIILLIARIILAAVFGLAGATKIADPAGSRKAMTGFGVPENLATVAGWALPVFEILAAIALLPLGTAWLGSIGALALLLIFLAGIGVNLARGNAPDCHCFGQLHSEPVSWKVFARNAVLALIAIFIVLQGQANQGLSAFGWLADLKAGEIVTLVISIGAVALLIPAIIFLRRILQQQSSVLEKLDAMKKLIDEDYAEPAPIEREDALPPVEGLPVGAPAPDFSLAALNGAQISLPDLLAKGNPVLLLFISPNCNPCKALLPLLRVWQRDYAGQLTIALLSKGEPKEIENRIAKYDAEYLLLQAESNVADAYQALWTPAAVVISREGKIASQATYGDEAIRALVTHTVTTMSAASNGNGHQPQIAVGSSLFKVGESAPRFSLPDLQGKTVNAEDLLGRASMLLFWDPGCPFCQAMTEDLKRWEEKTPNGAPQLVLVMSGNEEAIREKGSAFKSLVLSDTEFDIGPMFGTNSTPSAVLLDGEGRIASSLAKGEKNILALAGVRKVSLPIAAKN